MSATHAKGGSLEKTVLEYADLLVSSGGGSIARYMTSDGVSDDPEHRGGMSEVRKALASLGHRGFIARLWTVKDLRLEVIAADDAIEVNISYPAEAESRPELAEWVAVMARVARGSIDFTGFQDVVVGRRPSAYTKFAPSPPLARRYHLVTVTDEEVADAYDDPASYWSAWERVEPIGKIKVCTRGLRDLDEVSWMARTFESQMALARAAKPGRTDYPTKPHWDDAFAPWWKYGDLNQELAGFPALSPNGYDAETHTLEVVGYVSRSPLEQGGPEPRHVLIRELLEMRAIAQKKRDGQGRAVDAVNVVFLEEWMARSERRPLLDAGINVFYLDKQKGRVRVE